MVSSDVPLGATVIVRPGERIPLDGEVTKGESTVNQAPITGESMPVAKTTGDEVYAGTINQEGALEVRSTKASADTTLARIIHMVESAQSRRARSEQWVDRFAVYYTPFMMFVAIAIAVVPPLAFAASWAEWVYRGLVILVIACPCALVISTPVSIVSALTASARAGVLIKGGVYLEAAGRLKALALDKTGTLTQGRPEVQRIVPLNGHTEQDILERAAGLEANSEHPLARAIVRKARDADIQPAAAEGFQAIRGKGAEEGSSIFLLEAMALGRPVVATNIGGNPETIIDGMTGLLVPERDHEALSHAMWSLLDDGYRAREIGLAARSFIAENRNWKIIADRYVEQYRILMEKKNRI